MKRQQALTAILAALPALILAVCSWLNAQAKAAEARQAYAGYGEYVTDQLHRDEALLKALQDCQDLLRLKPALYNAYAIGGSVATSKPPEGSSWETLPVPTPTPQPQAQVVLDDVARSRGWGQEVTK